MVDIWGTDGEGVVAKRTPSSSVDDREDAHLLNGPALEGGVSQDDIDAMFGGDGTDQNAAAESATEVREGAEILADGEVPSRKKSPSMKKTRERSEEHTSELQSLMRISYAVFCLKKKKNSTYQKYSRQH